MNELIVPYLRGLLFEVPFLLVCLIGLMLALVLCFRSPLPSILVILGTGLYVLNVLVVRFAGQYVSYSFNQGNLEREQLETTYQVIAVVGSLTAAVATALLIAAALVGRGRPEQK